MNDIEILRDVVPADALLLQTSDPNDHLKLDQSALTGESQPVDKYAGELIYSGTAVKQGEMKAVVVETGSNTFLGKSALLVSGEQRESNIQVVLARIGWYCIFLIVIWVTVELIVLFVAYGDTCHGVGSGHCSVLGNALVIVVGGVPIAMPTVVSVTLALGAQQLAKQKAIVRRITAVEELAGMDMLCSDKTGTLTKNRLSVAEPIPYDGEDPEDVIIKAALASARDTDDAIDNAMYDNIEEDRKNELENYTVLGTLNLPLFGLRSGQPYLFIIVMDIRIQTFRSGLETVDG
jgi:H+-transporting ATPase